MTYYENLFFFVTHLNSCKMDNGSIVAIVTVLATIISNVIIKWRESNHKLQEHKLSIRSEYVKRKIEAGIDLIKHINKRKEIPYELYEFYSSLFTNNLINVKIATSTMTLMKAQQSSYDNNSRSAFFDITDWEFESLIILDEINENLKVIHFVVEDVKIDNNIISAQQANYEAIIVIEKTKELIL